MRKERVLYVVETYRNLLEKNGINASRFENNSSFPKLTAITLSHCFWMLGKIKEFIQADKMGKAFRWLGFVQGCFWCVMLRSIDEMRDDNREATA